MPALTIIEASFFACLVVALAGLMAADWWVGRKEVSGCVHNHTDNAERKRNHG